MGEKDAEVEASQVSAEGGEEQPHKKAPSAQLHELGEGPEEASDLEREEEAELEHEHLHSNEIGLHDVGLPLEEEELPHTGNLGREFGSGLKDSRVQAEEEPYQEKETDHIEQEELRPVESSKRPTISIEKEMLHSVGQEQEQDIDAGRHRSDIHEVGVEARPADVVPRVLESLSESVFSPQTSIESHSSLVIRTLTELVTPGSLTGVFHKVIKHRSISLRSEKADFKRGFLLKHVLPCHEHSHVVKNKYEVESDRDCLSCHEALLPG